MKRFAPTALMLGNFVTGTSILAPAGMLPELAHEFDITIQQVGLLFTFGAIVLCVGSPVSAWVTSRFDRRWLLTFSVAVMTAAQFVTAVTTNFTALMAVRLVMLAVAVLYTPQAAGTAAMLVPAERRGGMMSYVFLGWSLAIALGMPIVTYVTSHMGWRAAYLGIGAVGLMTTALLIWKLPAGLHGVPVDLKTWRDLLRNPLILLLLVVSLLQTSGQFTVFTFLGPLLAKLGGAGPELVAASFGIYGIMGLIGNVVASRVVDRWGAYRTSLRTMSLLLLGLLIWALGGGLLPVMLASMVPWGLGFASANSMQQVRLANAAPEFASATVSLNTSLLYAGQAVGSGVGGALFARELFDMIGYVGTGFLAASLLSVVLSRRFDVVR